MTRTETLTHVRLQLHTHKDVMSGWDRNREKQACQKKNFIIWTPQQANQEALCSLPKWWNRKFSACVLWLD